MNANNYLKIGQRIKQLRLSKGISQKFLAEELGIPVPTLSNYEAGRREFPEDLITNASKALGCSDSDIVPPSVHRADGGFFFYFDQIDDEECKRAFDTGYNLGIDSKKKNQLLKHFEQLNEIGQEEAVKRVEELTEIEKYKKQD